MRLALRLALTFGLLAAASSALVGVAVRYRLVTTETDRFHEDVKGVCKRIKGEPELASINIVLVTACGEDNDRERGRLAGANGYFVKPLSPLALANHFRSALKDDTGAAPGAA